MSQKNFAIKAITVIAKPITVIVFAVTGISCGTGQASLEEPPIITSATYQHTLYNGMPQPIDAQAAKADTAPFIITYFPSEDALYSNDGGTAEPPSEVGSYYARIERPAGNGYAAGPNVKVEYYIQKSFVNIQAEEKQEVFYDGNPKRITATADPPVELSTAYFPTQKAREAAALPESQAGQRAQALRGLTRVERPPSEPGLYYVTVYYQGDQNYRPAAKEIEFSIINNR
ncbi:MAG: hypothetical protein LBN21_10065 [Treponema sp.]|jgi:hypothetical protein|nr:hypothetical protein [Treponema sp.]